MVVVVMAKANNMLSGVCTAEVAVSGVGRPMEVVAVAFVVALSGW